MVSAVALFFIKLYDAKRNENPRITASEVLMDILNVETIASTARALQRPKYGDIGSFVGYTDSTLSKRSGLGGTIHRYSTN